MALDWPSDGPGSGLSSVRVVLSHRSADSILNGAWWPRSRDLEVEVKQLVDYLAMRVGLVHRVRYAATDWDVQPGCPSIKTSNGSTQTDPLPSGSNVMLLSMITQTHLRLMVVPPSFDARQARAALSLASNPDNRLTANQIAMRCVS